VDLGAGAVQRTADCRLATLLELDLHPLAPIGLAGILCRNAARAQQHGEAHADGVCQSGFHHL